MIPTVATTNTDEPSANNSIIKKKPGRKSIVKSIDNININTELSSEVIKKEVENSVNPKINKRRSVCVAFNETSLMQPAEETSKLKKPEKIRPFSGHCPSRRYI